MTRARVPIECVITAKIENSTAVCLTSERGRRRRERASPINFKLTLTTSNKTRNLNCINHAQTRRANERTSKQTPKWKEEQKEEEEEPKTKTGKLEVEIKKQQQQQKEYLAIAKLNKLILIQKNIFLFHSAHATNTLHFDIWNFILRRFWCCCCWRWRWCLCALSN